MDPEYIIPTVSALVEILTLLPSGSALATTSVIIKPKRGR